MRVNVCVCVCFFQRPLFGLVLKGSQNANHQFWSPTKYTHTHTRSLPPNMIWSTTAPFLKGKTPFKRVIDLGAARQDAAGKWKN